MDPYIEAWEQSSHRDVACVKCHYPPGNEFETKLAALNQVVAYATGQYGTKFHAEIDDASCLRSGCHDTRLLPGPIVFQRNIKFDHSDHLGDEVRNIKLRCTSCHSQIVQGSHMTVTEITCFLCHFKGRVSPDEPQTQAFCLRCHGYPQEPVAVADSTFNHRDAIERGLRCQRCHLDTVRGDGFVEDRACLQCHADPEQLDKITDPQNVHKNHVTDHKVECFNCHSDIEHSIYPTTENPIASCSMCHQGTHQGPRELYQGTGGYGVEDMPSPMYLGQVDCIGCHLMLQDHGDSSVLTGTIKTFSEYACANCHDESYLEILQNWRVKLAADVRETKAVLERTERRVKQSSVELEDEQRVALEQARSNFNLVAYGIGLHNFEYSRELLKWTRETCNRIESAL
jgi:hypothetical protein